MKIAIFEEQIIEKIQFFFFAEGGLFMHTKLKRQIALALLTGTIVVPATGQAMPAGQHDMVNVDAIKTTGKNMEISGRGNSVIKWNDFSVAKDEGVKFAGMRNALNIVDGHKMSHIDGALSGTGINVYLVNPSGTIFSSTSSVDVGSLTTSVKQPTVEMTNSFAAKGILNTDEATNGIGNITLAGKLNAKQLVVDGNNVIIGNDLSADKVRVTIADNGHLDALKGTDISKYDISGGTVRADFEAVDSQDELATLDSNGHYMLTKDINLDDSWSGIKSSDPDKQFDGLVLDGLGHTVSFENESGQVFGNDLKNSTVRNIAITGKDGLFQGHAMIADNATDLIIDNLKNSRNNTYQGKYNGMFDKVNNAVITNAENEGTVNVVSVPGESTGAFIGHAEGNVQLENVHNKGNISGDESNYYFEDVGGIIGSLDGNISLENASNKGDITAENNLSYAGGLIGYINKNSSQKETTIKDVYNSGKLIAKNGNAEMTAGIIGGVLANQPIDFTLEDVKQYGTIDSGSDGLRRCGGVIGYTSFNEPQSTIKLNNIENFGDLIHINNYVGGIWGENSDHKNNKYILSNIRNNGNLYLFNKISATGGIIGKFLSNAYLTGENIENNGNIVLDKDILTDDDYMYIDDVGGIFGAVSIHSGKFTRLSNKGNLYLTPYDKKTYTNTSSTGGLFGAVGSPSFDLSDSYNIGNITISKDGTGNYTGGIAGSISQENAIIKNVYNTGNIAGVENVGGLIGGNIGKKSILENVFNAGNISGNHGLGGMFGWNQSGKTSVFNSYNSGNIITYSDYRELNIGAGGILGMDCGIGLDDDSLVIKNTYNTGNINPENIKGNNILNLGGIVGDTWRKNITLDNVYSFGNVSGNGQLGGIIGTIELNGNKVYSLNLSNIYAGGELYTDGAKGSIIGSLTSYGKNNITIQVNNVNTSIKTDPLGEITLPDEEKTIKKESLVNALSKVTTSHKDAKKANSYAGFEIDTNGNNPNATWRIYEGQTAPLLSVFMNRKPFHDSLVFSNEYDGKTHNVLTDSVLNPIPSKNFFTNYIDYTKDNHIFSATNSGSNIIISGKDAGTYKGKIYSDQLGFNFDTLDHDDSVTLKITPKKLLVDANVMTLQGYASSGTYHYSLAGLVGPKEARVKYASVNDNVTDLDKPGYYKTSPGNRIHGILSVSDILLDGDNGFKASNYLPEFNIGVHTVIPKISAIYPIYNFHIKKGDYSFIDKNVLLDKTEQTRVVKKNKLVIDQTKVKN